MTTELPEDGVTDAQAHELLKFVLFGHDEPKVQQETPMENHGLWDTGNDGAPVGASCRSLSIEAVCMLRA